MDEEDWPEQRHFLASGSLEGTLDGARQLLEKVSNCLRGAGLIHGFEYRDRDAPEQRGEVAFRGH